MNANQIGNVCRYYGLAEWQPAYCRLILDYRIDDREFGRLIRRPGRFRDALEMMKAVLSAPYLAFFGPDAMAEAARALAIAG